MLPGPSCGTRRLDPPLPAIGFKSWHLLPLPALGLEYWHLRINSGYHIQLFHERPHDHSPSLPSDGSGCFV
jgi:hypothetical protein